MDAYSIVRTDTGRECEDEFFPFVVDVYTDRHFFCNDYGCRTLTEVLAVVDDQRAPIVEVI